MGLSSYLFNYTSLLQPKEISIKLHSWNSEYFIIMQAFFAVAVGGTLLFCYTVEHVSGPIIKNVGQP
jgi:hypothetical protein